MTQIQYPNQSARIRKEIMLALDGGMKDKQEIYSIVATNTDSPRPTVRRVASALKKELEAYHKILSDTRHMTGIAPEYDCPECKAKRIIKKGDKRCPECQIVLDWSDV